MTNKLQVRDANPSQRQYNNEYYQSPYPYQQVPIPMVAMNNSQSINNSSNETVQEPSSESAAPVHHHSP